MVEPKIGDTRVREGFLETYEMVQYRGWVGPGRDDPDPEPAWVRGKLVDGAHAVELYSVQVAWRAHVTLGPHERIVGVSNLGGGSQLVWIEQDSVLTSADRESGKP